MTTAFKLYLCAGLVLVGLASGVKLPSLSQVRSMNPITESWNRMTEALKQAERAAQR